MVTGVGHYLSAAQNAQLLALQKTARQLDGVSARLASGLKVTSALDNPNSYFVARALRSRAGDLEKLLDGIGQSIRTIEEADHGIKAQLKILDTAESFLREVEHKMRTGQIPLADVPVNETYITFTNAADFQPYAGAQDAPLTGTPVVTGNNEVYFQGNLWKYLPLNYNVTADTRLILDYQSTLPPEISAIGFENDDNQNNDNDRFRLYGTQSGGLNYAAPAGDFAYTGAGAWQSIEIPIGQYFTGNFSRLAFIHDDDAAPYGNAAFRNITLREGVAPVYEDTSTFEAEYIKIISQLDDVAEDAHYRGIHLLKNDKMTTYFNPSRSNNLVTEGMDATVKGLGLDLQTPFTLDAVRDMLDKIGTARETLRRFGSTLATDLTVLEVRNDFTNDQINNAKQGANDLTVADLNEEGANLLALQVRQQMQMTVLSLRPTNILQVLA